MIKQDYYATDRQGNCVNSGINCFSCSHWHGYFDNGSCDMFKVTSTTTSSVDGKMTEKSFKIEEYLVPLSVRTNCVSRFLKAYKIMLKSCNEEELEEIFDNIRFDWKQFNNKDGVEMSINKIGKCYWCVSFDELCTGEFFCNRYNEIIDEKKVVNEENCEDWVGDVE